MLELKHVGYETDDNKEILHVVRLYVIVVFFEFRLGF